MNHRVLHKSVFVLGIAACGGGSSGVTTPPPPPGTPPPAPPPPPAAIAAVSGDGQVGAVGVALALPLRVVVTQAGSPLSGQSVVWQTSGGTVSPSPSVTGADGSAAGTWTLGQTSGSQSASAFVGSTAGASIGFSALGAVVAPGPTVQVELFTAGGSRFVPAAVIIPVGTTVNWVWRDGTHSVVSNGTPSFPNGSSSDPPRTYSFTFNAPGTYRYYCFEHGAPGAGMFGVVVVQ